MDKQQYKPVPDVECLKYHGTPEKPDIKIFVSHRIDLDSETVDNPLYIPVRCGAVFDEREDITMLGDDTGDNISGKRESYCELTVQYWAWKNVDADYYGLCHYRRYMSFGEKMETDCYGSINLNYIDQENLKVLGLREADEIISKIKDYDIILSEPFNVRNAPKPFSNLYEQYEATETMHPQDLQTVMEIIKEREPEYYETAQTYLSGTLFYPDNLFIMKREMFHKYCNWLFPILADLEKIIHTEHYNLEEMRAVGMVAERLLGVFVEYQKKTSLKYCILQRAIFWNTERNSPPLPHFKNNNIPVVFACSNYFVPYMAVSLYSMLANASKEYNYDLILLSTDLEPYMKKNLQKMLMEFPNCHLRVLNVTPHLEGKSFTVNGAHVSKETFYRLLVPDLFSHYDRILYLDSDLIIQADVSELYQIDMGDNLIAASVDADFVGEYKGGIEFVKPYCDNTLKLEDPYRYFQAGVLVFNTREMRKCFEPGELINYAQKSSYLYVDQDVLNVKCAGKIKYLDIRWNVMTDCASIRIKQFISRAPVELYHAYMEARKTPAIIHYAGFEKPWNSPLSDFADIFWYYARQTLFYEAIIFRMRDETIISIQSAVHDIYNKIGTPNPQIQQLQDNRSGARKLADRLMPKGTRRREFAKKILPKGSKRWNFCKKIYLFFSPQKSA